MTFADLHHAHLPMLLPNAWDVPSALAFLDAGFPAIGTTSFGVSSSIGRPDGGRASREANLVLASALTRLPCHLSMDIEDGYAEAPDTVAGYVAQLGVAGVNIEDSTAGQLIAREIHAAKVAAVKARTPEVFVNARVDTFWLHQEQNVAQTIERALAYVEAGADGVFVPGVSAPDLLRELTGSIPVPVNVLALPGMSLAEIGALGVRRVSTGSLPYRAALRTAIEVADAVRDGRQVPAATPYPQLQDRLARYQESIR